jgi:5-methyltetrahydropteroyltriglutamate--homocysteine methyltransferase
MGKILATHTGSLIRPPELLSFLAAGERGESYDEDAYAETLRGAVQDVVDRQIDAGIDIVDDGEMGKASWITYITRATTDIRRRRSDAPGWSEAAPRRGPHGR